MLTFGNWIVIICTFLCGILLAFVVGFAAEEVKPGIIISIGTVIICIILFLTVAWYNTSTEQGRRALKDNESNFNGGIYREITITAEDGREIFHYEGKVDIETSHEGSENYILFESEDGRRYIIYYGITDTVLIVEKSAAAD